MTCCLLISTQFLFLIFLFTDIPDGDAVGNEILFNFLIENIKSFHQHEIMFTLEDSFIFPFLVYHRDRDLQENPVPFPHPKTTSNLLTLNQYLASESLRTCPCDDCPLLDAAGYSLAHADLEDDSIAKWRCFIKGCSSSHVILTMVPASFCDLKKLYPQNFHKPEQSFEMPESDSTKDENNPCEKPEADTFASEMQNVIENAVHENDDNVSLEFELLHIPMYVYSGVSSSVVNQLISSSQCENINDSFIKFGFEYENCVDDQSYVSSALVITPSQLSEERETQKKKVKEDYHYLNLKDHCSLIEKSHSKAFVYSVYR